MNAVQANGIKLRIGQYHLRVWKHGFEFGNRLGGRVIFFPWVQKFQIKRKLK